MKDCLKWQSFFFYTDYQLIAKILNKLLHKTANKNIIWQT